MNDQARELMAKVESGVRIESVQEMTDEYRENLIHLLTMQADSELAGGYGYVPWITKAPGVAEKHVVAQIVKDEIRHATVMYGLLADLGVETDAHVRAHDEVFTMRIAADADIGTRRITDDKRVKRLAEGAETHDEAQATFGKWYVRTMNIFGRPGSPKNAVYRKYRLKLRDNDEVRRAFADEVTERAEAVGLTVPAWTPVWEQ